MAVENLPIAGMIFIPNDEVYGEPFQTPVGMGLDHLPHQIDVGWVSDLEQYDRQIA